MKAMIQMMAFSYKINKHRKQRNDERKSVKKDFYNKTIPQRGN